MAAEPVPALAAFLRLNRLLFASAWSHWKDLDISMAQLKAVMTLSESECLTLSGLAQKLGTKPSATSILVDRLVNQGLVRRVEDEADRRRVLLSLTEQAGEVVGRAREGRARIGDGNEMPAVARHAGIAQGLREVSVHAQRFAGATAGLCDDEE